MIGLLIDADASIAEGMGRRSRPAGAHSDRRGRLRCRAKRGAHRLELEHVQRDSRDISEQQPELAPTKHQEERRCPCTVISRSMYDGPGC